MLHTTMFLGYACNRSGTYFNLLVWTGAWRVVEHVNDWCFRDIYKGGLWEDDLDVCSLKRVSPVFGVSFMKTPMEHYLDDLCPVLHFTATNFQEPGYHVI